MNGVCILFPGSINRVGSESYQFQEITFHFGFAQQVFLQLVRSMAPLPPVKYHSSI